MLDRRPRSLSDRQVNALKSLANQVVKLLDLRAANLYLKQALFEKDKLLGIISHDLRAPFHSILALAEILAQNSKQLSRAEMEELAQDVFMAAEPAHRLVENLLQWSLLETEAIRFRPEWFNLSHLIGEIFTLLFTSAKLKKVKLINNCSPDLSIYGDRDQIRCVLQNLVTNSIKFCLARGEVSIEAIASPGRIEVLIVDNGVGISDLQMQAIQSNQGFYSSQGTGGEPGTGLGLNLCRRMIAAHEGEFLISSEPGRGTRVRVILPQPKLSS